MMNSSTTHPPTQSPPSSSPTIPFGVHKGKRLDELPADYLIWLGCLDDLRQPLLGHVLKEMARRILEMDRPSATVNQGAR
jgi:uncharacterized protein (DUF3820 family)